MVAGQAMCHKLMQRWQQKIKNMLMRKATGKLRNERGQDQRGASRGCAHKHKVYMTVGAKRRTVKLFKLKPMGVDTRGKVSKEWQVAKKWRAM
jgi:hypothetical protein